MSGIIQKGARRFTTQIGAGGVTDAIVTTIPLVSVSGLPTDTPIEIVVDRTDSSGVFTPAKEEVIRGTVSGLNLINCTRGVEGTAQAHSAGATVNAILTSSMWNNTAQYILDLPARGLIGGYIRPTVTSNNLTLAISLDPFSQVNPTPSNPVGIIINNVLRWITTPLSVTAPAGFNWFNSGSAELATREVDYFAFIGLSTANNLAIGFAPFPYYRLGSQFNDTVTNQYYGRFTDTTGTVLTTTTQVTSVVNVGIFAATLSAGAGHTWTVPTYTNDNLIQEPCFNTSQDTWVPVYGAGGGMTYTGVTTGMARYTVVNNTMNLNLLARGIIGGTASNAITATMPRLFDIGASSFPTNIIRVSAYVRASNGSIEIGYATIASQSNVITFNLNTSTNFPLGSNTDIGLSITIPLT